MPLRLLLSLVLVLPQLALPAAAAARTPARACAETSCCAAIELVTCCGTTVIEHRCGHSGGACLCGIDADDTAPAPKAPPAVDRLDLAGHFAPASLRSELARAGRRVVGHPATGHRSHNETRALLCIWRT
jgi:hypothetical protein